MLIPVGKIRRNPQNEDTSVAKQFNEQLMVKMKNLEIFPFPI